MSVHIDYAKNQHELNMALLRYDDQFNDPPQFLASRQWIFELQKCPKESWEVAMIREAFANGA